MHQMSYHETCVWNCKCILNKEVATLATKAELKAEQDQIINVVANSGVNAKK